MIAESEPLKNQEAYLPEQSEIQTVGILEATKKSVRSAMKMRINHKNNILEVFNYDKV